MKNRSVFLLAAYFWFVSAQVAGTPQQSPLPRWRFPYEAASAGSSASPESAPGSTIGEPAHDLGSRETAQPDESGEPGRLVREGAFYLPGRNEHLETENPNSLGLLPGVRVVTSPTSDSSRESSFEGAGRNVNWEVVQAVVNNVAQELLAAWNSREPERQSVDVYRSLGNLGNEQGIGFLIERLAGDTREVVWRYRPQVEGLLVRITIIPSRGSCVIDCPTSEER